MSPMDGDGVRAERLSTALWGVTVALGIAGAVLTLVVWRSLDPADGFPNLFSGLSGVFYATLGAVIVRRARNPIGWILQGVALGLVLLSFAGAYSVAGLVWRPGWSPVQWSLVASPNGCSDRHSRRLGSCCSCSQRDGCPRPDGGLSWWWAWSPQPSPRSASS